jgi:hypothetical protein
MRHRRSTAISYLRTVVLAAQDVSSSFGIPGLSLGIGSLFLILDAVQVCAAGRRSCSWVSPTSANRKLLKM